MSVKQDLTSCQNFVTIFLLMQGFELILKQIHDHFPNEIMQKS